MSLSSTNANADNEGNEEENIDIAEGHKNENGYSIVVHNIEYQKDLLEDFDTLENDIIGKTLALKK